MSDAVRIEKIGEQPGESGGVVHSHDVYDGDTKVGSFHAHVSPQGKVGFKLKGVKMKHVNHVIGYMQSNYEKPPEKVAKAMADDGMTAKPDTTVPQVELSHDRRRIKLGIAALLGKKETPHSPDGKINKSLEAIDRDWLAKSIVTQTQIDAARPHMEGLARELISRPNFGVHHDYSAWMITHAHHQLKMADKHLNRPKPSMLDRVRSGLGMESAHQKHLKAAQTYLQAAESFMHMGDKVLHEQNPSSPAPKKSPTLLNRADYKLVQSATKDREDAIKGSADRLRGFMGSSSAGSQASAKPKAPSRKRQAAP
jgi:hypothetical protein